MTGSREERTETLSEAIEQTIGEWLARNGGGMLQGFALGITYIDEDGDRSWSLSYRDDQSPIETLGSLRLQMIAADNDVLHYLTDPEGDA